MVSGGVGKWWLACCANAVRHNPSATRSTVLAGRFTWPPAEGRNSILLWLRKSSWRESFGADCVQCEHVVPRSTWKSECKKRADAAARRHVRRSSFSEKSWGETESGFGQVNGWPERRGLDRVLR